MKGLIDVILVIALLKAVVATQGAIACRSEAAEKVSHVLMELVAVNSAHAIQGIRHIAALAWSSRGFVLEVAIQTVSAFRQLCEQHNPFQLARQIVALWESGIVARTGERLLLTFLRETGVLTGLCGLFEAVGGDHVLRRL
jgi:hypothetical protein